MKKISSFPVLLLLALAALAACSDNDIVAENEEPPVNQSNVEGALPVIKFDVASARYRAMVGSPIVITPTYENVDDATTYEWTQDGVVIGTGPTLTYTATKEGESFIQLTVTNAYGSKTDELKVTAAEGKTTDEQTVSFVDNDSVFSWRFPWTCINVPVGRTLKVKAYMIENDLGGTYTWVLDGATVAGPTTRQEQGGEVSYVFDASSAGQGQHRLTLTMQNDTCSYSQQFLLTVCPPEGTYRRGVTTGSQSLVNKVYEYMPAPGHQVNGYTIVGDFIHDGATMEEACAKALRHFQNQWSVSLGGQGGYLIAGFDHSVEVSRDDYDLVIRSNPFSYQSEPGIIWVSQDVNGDGLPNDPWYELAGSEYGTENETLEYAITYYKPTSPRSATGWRDCFGETGMVPHMAQWNEHDYYWQDWVEGHPVDVLGRVSTTVERTYFGTRLKDTHTYDSGYTYEPPFAWGYADNLGSDYFRNKTFDAGNTLGYYKISNAKTWDGQEANLQYIDFVKVQTGQTGYSPNLGEISTEVYTIFDYHIKK